MKLIFRALLVAAATAILPLPTYAEQAQIVKTCKKDVKALCLNVERGQGRIIRCLADHVKVIAPECKATLESMHVFMNEKESGQKGSNTPQAGGPGAAPIPQTGTPGAAPIPQGGATPSPQSDGAKQPDAKPAN